ncbi:uncharacterized protein LOC113520476 [Galleria mellonella]|uniref:Uncharacterized protein LOC113520476 n=1 Tax=Galleria mellonella TaxID=7137 RepID=A0A6J1X5W7_GALME|nr:uncharacterized protein LOC113520476 [Galleria mellonella]
MMTSKTFAFFFLQFAIFNIALTQVLNRVIPNYGNLLPLGEAVVPNQILLNHLAPNVIPAVAPNLVNYEVPGCVDTILSSPVTVPTTTIIQDSTVANNLANALQLLVVSNLLSNTLPTMGDVVVPNYAAPVEMVSPVAVNGLPGYNYVF